MLRQILVRTEVFQLGRWEERWLQATDLDLIQEERWLQATDLVRIQEERERARQEQVLRDKGRVLMATARQRVVAQMEKARALAVNQVVALGKRRLRSRERIRLHWCLRA